MYHSAHGELVPESPSLNCQQQSYGTRYTDQVLHSITSLKECCYQKTASVFMDPDILAQQIKEKWPLSPLS